MRSFVLAFSFFAVASVLCAQPALWQAYPSFRSVQSLSASNDAVWVGTDGGVYRYGVASGEIERYTPVEGLAGVDARAIAYDARRGAVWIGYPSGVLDRLDVETGNVETIVDIARADQFSSRAVNRIDVVGDSLLIATGFGLVIFDATAVEVSDTYERFSSFRAGTETFAALRAPLPTGEAGLWVGTREGVAYAPLDAPNLREPSAWTVEEQGPNNVRSLAYFQGQMFAGSERVTDEDGNRDEGGVYTRNAEGGWDLLPYGTETVPTMIVDGDRLLIASVFKTTVREADGSTSRYDIDGLFSFSDAVIGPDGGLWVGDLLNGLLAYPDLDTTPPGSVEPRVEVVPDGPGTNEVLTVGAAANGEVWAGFAPPNNRTAAFGTYDASRWSNYSVVNGTLDDQAAVVAIVRDGLGSVWLSSRGRGVFQVTDEGEVERFTVGNSSLAESGGFENYVDIRGLAVDEDDYLWVTNRLATPPLHVRTPDGDWTGLRPPASLPSTITFHEITIDSFGQKWIGTRSTNTRAGTGLVVLDTAGTPLDPSDDRAVYVGSAGSVGSGLPSEDIRAIVEDRSGRMWIGTTRGLATVLPSSIFVGDAASQIVWTRNPEGTEFFLRDLLIYDIAVDPADRKWLASSSGAWLINPDGNEVIANLTTENSPLPSDEVLSVDVDESDGTVYFATSGGVYSYRGDSVAPVREAEDLFVYPNPVRAGGGSLPPIAITGLVDEADVRVLTVDGQLVAAFATRGGSITWDGRDQRTGDFVPSGVYLVVADGEDGTAYGKVAVIR